MATNCTEVIRLLCGKFCVVDTIKCRLVSRGWKEAVDDENRSSWCKPCKCCRNNWRQKSPYPTSVYPLKRVTTSLNAYYVKKCSGFLEYIESLPHEQLSTDVYRSQNDIVTKMDLPLEWSLLDFTLQTNIHQIETLMKQWASLYSRSDNLWRLFHYNSEWKRECFHAGTDISKTISKIVVQWNVLRNDTRTANTSLINPG